MSSNHEEKLDLVEPDLPIASEVVDLDAIICQLDEANHEVPVSAILAARQHREVIVPRLVQTIDRATHQARHGAIPAGNAHFFAFFLLAEFRACEAVPAILNAAALPDDMAYELYGDAIIDPLPQVLAAIAFESLDQVDKLILNNDADPFVCWSAASTYGLLVRDGRITREQAVARLHHLFLCAMNEERYELASFLITELEPFSPHEVFDDIKKAFNQDVVHTEYIGLDDIEASIAGGEEHVQRSLQRCPPTGYDDVIAELQSWNSFSGEQDSSDEDDDSNSGWDDDDDWNPHDIDDANLPFGYRTPDILNGILGRYVEPPVEPVSDVPTTIRNDRPKVGRNDPCPCGSGKKHKKCCGKQ